MISNTYFVRITAKLLNRTHIYLYDIDGNASMHCWDDCGGGGHN